MGSVHWHSWFTRHVVEFDLATSEGISLDHYSVQYKNYKISCVRSSNFYNRKDCGGNALVAGNSPRQITNQAYQGEGKGKGGDHLLKSCAIGSTCRSKRLEGFPFEGNVRS